MRGLFHNTFLAFAYVLIASFIAAADPPSSSVAYFSNVRDVKITDAAKQNYIVLDPAIFDHARADLADLRLFADKTEVPYALVTKRGSTEPTLSSIPILNKGKVGGATRFNVDVGIPEYDDIHLEISAKDFIAQARLEGANQASGPDWTDLGSFTIFDFTKERLGKNFDIHLTSPSRFRFLRITITGPVQPEDFTGAAVANLREIKTQYVVLPETPAKTSDGVKTVFQWDASERVPLDRLQVEVDLTRINFNRTATLDCDGHPISSQELSRIHLVRKGRNIDSENLNIDLPGLRCKHYKVEIDNGNDQPLRIRALHPQMVERRAYFDPHGNAALKLYYGDEELPRPEYDYAKLFEEPDAKDVAQALLSADSHNSAFTGRPDERPWSEQHPAVLWITMIAAVGLLGLWALKGFKA